jgi:hypothetical protein
MMSANFTAKASCDADLAFENEHRGQPDRSMGEPIGLADCVEFLRVDAAEHEYDVYIGGRS